MDDDTVTQVWLSVHKLKTKDGEDKESPKRDVILTNDEEGIKLLFTLFKILKNEFIEAEELTEDIIFKYLKSFVNEFERNGDLTETIKKKLNKLERYKFYKNSELIEITGEEITERIKSLRSKRIRLWKAISERYNENKENYNNKLSKYSKPPRIQE